MPRGSCVRQAEIFVAPFLVFRVARDRGGRRKRLHRAWKARCPIVLVARSSTGVRSAPPNHALVVTTNGVHVHRRNVGCEDARSAKCRAQNRIVGRRNLRANSARIRRARSSSAPDLLEQPPRITLITPPRGPPEWSCGPAGATKRRHRRIERCRRIVLEPFEGAQISSRKCSNSCARALRSSITTCPSALSSLVRLACGVIGVSFPQLSVNARLRYRAGPA